VGTLWDPNPMPSLPKNKLTTARFRVLGRKDGLVTRVVQAIKAQILDGCLARTTHNPLLILLLDSIRERVPGRLCVSVF